MFAALNRTTDAAVEPITTTQAKTHLRVTHSDDDTYIDLLIKTARTSAEHYCGRAFNTQTWVATFNGTDCERLRLPYPKLIGITSIQYRDGDGTLQTTSLSDYEANIDNEPGVVKFLTVPAYDATYENPLRVTYTAGYGASASDVPEDIKHALKLLLTHWYNHRQSVVNSNEIAPVELPQGIKWLLDPYKFRYS